jgi:hypothetical protein
MVNDPGPYVDIFGQLGSISAVLGGFAFAAAGALLAAVDAGRRRAGSIAIGCAVLAASCFILCALSGLDDPGGGSDVPVLRLSAVVF